MASSVLVAQSGPPSPPPDRATVSVHALSAGHFTLPEYQFVHPVSKDARKTVPSLAFLIQHHNVQTGKRTRIVFDLGLRRDISRYAPAIQKHTTTRQPMTTDPDVVKSLARGGLTPNDIDYVLYSHIHWDHIGEPRDFPSSTFLVGHGALALLHGTSSALRGGHSFFESDLLPEGRTIELSKPSVHDLAQHKPDTVKWGEELNLSHWKPYNHLPSTLDMFNDGSFLIVDAPGHLPGHVNILAQISERQQVYLGGDACHDRRLLTGEKQVGEWNDAEGHICCIHADRKAAEETIQRIRQLESEGVEIIFAHDVDWENEPGNNPEQQSLKERFDAELGASAFDASWSRLLRHSPEMFAASLRLTAVPKRKGHLTPKIQSLISLAVAAASTHLHVPNIQRYTQQALSNGATKAEIVETLCLTSTLGIHACNIGVPLLVEVLREEGREVKSGMDGMSKQQWELKEEFEKKRGYWHGFWEDFLRMSPEFFGAYVEFSSVPWVNEGGKGVLEPKVKELIYCAFDCAATHLYKPGLKLHMKNVLGYGGTPEEIMEVLELASLLSISTMDVALPILEKELESQ
ncbi:Metallo-hydrolase/oxidoreductase [Paraphaeosphaeria sporulosa]|uniref:Metallo-hydrolase/oxidoreductase n=1 Tax=Paraphaeosphaeria sporulosa TaxID=1460663 RepID=A0A177CXS9_9PLEO|nr:Metallo-hydrolase/oxidoreductase [Paraphaeosphaeria sporulosa]OAG11637.1 Metallo-hydrolase/oxidoreductase [Paraphaeosphaeria sporulosa]